jgi:anaerobic magnesium-protoporphyrin IX monomethyl ester cyclase
MQSPSFKIFEPGAPENIARDTSRPVMLVGFLTQANLGLGYLASVLREQGYRVVIVDFEIEPEQIIEIADTEKPMLIGFSLIFQFYIERFRDLIHALREHGVNCHFTIGGHFPSLSYRQTLELLPKIDSVVRFEGEQTLLELVDRIGAGQDWRGLQGIALRQGDDIVSNPVRPLIHDLDLLPYPDRDFTPTSILGQSVMPILASRGCARTCSFCSIHMFYRGAPGKVVRTRKPAEVVREMRYLCEERGASIFLFQDDDFPLFGPAWRRWAREFAGELHRSGLPGRIVWKISCRADAVDAELLAELRDAGLYMVYMGLESGTEEGLKTLHKQITAEQNLKAVAILKQLDIAFQFGFMLFEPSSTFDSIRENLQFLRAIVDDGCLAVTFCRMIPYDGTPIKETLIREGRLTGDITHPGYDFLDPKLDRFYQALTGVVDLTGWVHGYESLSPRINLAWSEIALLKRLFPPLPGMDRYEQQLRAITKSSNEVLFQILDDTARTFLEGVSNRWSKALLNEYCDGFSNELLGTRNGFMLRNQDLLLEAIERLRVRQEIRVQNVCA